MADVLAEIRSTFVLYLYSSCKCVKLYQCMIYIDVRHTWVRKELSFDLAYVLHNVKT